MNVENQNFRRHLADAHQNEPAYTLTNSDLAILPFIDFDGGLFLFPGKEHVSPGFTAHLQQ
jgi:hypothetical protein